MHDCSIIGKKPTLLPYHGWLVVAAAFLVALYGFGLGFYGPGIYLVALKALHGWPTSELSSAITTYYVLGATLLFFWVGPLFDRHGARKVVVVGTVAMAEPSETRQSLMFRSVPPLTSTSPPESNRTHCADAFGCPAIDGPTVMLTISLPEMLNSFTAPSSYAAASRVPA